MFNAIAYGIISVLILGFILCVGYILYDNFFVDWR